MAPEIIENDPGKQVFCCSECGYGLTLVAGDPKSGAVVRSVPIESVSPWNHYGLVDTVEIREYACPSRAHLLSVDVRLQDEPPLLDTFLNPMPAADRSIAAE